LRENILYNSKIILQASKEIGLDVSADKTKQTLHLCTRHETKITNTNSWI